MDQPSRYAYRVVLLTGMTRECYMLPEEQSHIVFRIARLSVFAYFY